MMMHRWTILLFVVGTALTGSAYAGSLDFIPGISGEFIPGGLSDPTEPDTILTDSEINTSKLYSPEVKPLDLSENPVGTLGALQELIDQLTSAADEIIHFIDSIFEMLGMEEREEVKNLKDALEDGRNLVKD
ncbi:hypothetical protein Metlim_2484 [Methanoplanus limicola DSM 2279]|uniref:Uncharacterized protein n=2 Tax=Methanoplanus limicola TaxID=2315 RepID=H1Z3B6_9EURY|nr:hypothetical protein Metlim_2484 [Methanoplanus limicola DSM 2279]